MYTPLFAIGHICWQSRVLGIVDFLYRPQTWSQWTEFCMMMRTHKRTFSITVFVCEDHQWDGLNRNSGLLCNIAHLSKNHLKLISREILFIYNVRFNDATVLKFCAEHGSIEMIRQQTDVMDVHGFTRLEFKMSFQQIFSIAQHPWGPS